MERLPVILALTPDAERGVEHLLFGRDAVLEVRGSAVEADELEREIATGQAVCVLVSPDLSSLSPGHCARVRACGVRVAGLAANASERQQLLALGVDEVVEPTDSAQDFVYALRGPAQALTSDERGPSISQERFVRDDGSGAVLAVIGSKGAPGASECAASLAILAAERWRCVLVELDALGGGLDLRLGVDPHLGSVLGVVRAVSSGDEGVGGLLERWLTVREGWPAALVGMPDPTRALGELASPGAVAGVLRALASLHPLVVADVGFLLFEGEDAGPACRVHRESVVAADAVLLVIGAREEQLRAGLDQLDVLLALEIAPERLRVVVNGVGGPGATARVELERVILAQLAERRIAPDSYLPWDNHALTRAQRTGLALARARRRGAYARALERLLDELFLPTVPAPRQRKLRLVPPPRYEEASDRERVAVL